MSEQKYSWTFKQKMVRRLTGANAVSATQLAKETGLRQVTLSKWLRDARSLTDVPRNRPQRPPVDDKIRILAGAAKLNAPELEAFLAREGVTLAELQQWRLALDQDGRGASGVTKRLKALERELARKDKALAEAAALLILKKKVESWTLGDEDDDTPEDNET
jgi:transposase